MVTAALGNMESSDTNTCGHRALSMLPDRLNPRE
jgi:hypothetical protein